MELLLLGVILVLLSSSIYGPPLWRAGRVYFYLRKRGERLCPETGRPASVQVDAFHAARTMLTSGVADLQVKDCARWPGHRGCGQSCLSLLSVAGRPEARNGNPASLDQQGA